MNSETCVDREPPSDELARLGAREPSRQAMLVIGYGNDLRGDDGAGIRVATRVAAQAPQIRAIATWQLTPDLAGDVAASAQVVFVDAYAANEAGAALRIERIFSAAAGSASVLGHHGDPAGLVALAERLFGCFPDAWVVGIPAFCFDAGDAISPETSLRIDQAVALVTARAFCGE
jgi:hydrogenase maturation protease